MEKEQKKQVSFYTTTFKVDEKDEPDMRTSKVDEIRIVQYQYEKHAAIICNGNAFIIQPERLSGMLQVFMHDDMKELLHQNNELVAQNRLLKNTLEICLDTLKTIV